MMMSNPTPTVSSKVRAGYILIVIFTILLSVGVVFTARSNADAIVLAVSMAAFIVVVFPIVIDKGYHLFEPLTFVIVSVVLGCTLKSFYLVLNTGQNFTVDEKLLLGLNIDSLVFGAIVLLVGLACFSFTYALTKSSNQRKIQPIKYRWSYQKVIISSALVTAMSFVAIVLFAERLGISFSNLDSLSAKRFRDDSGTVTASRTGTLDYLLYRIALLAKFPLYILFIWKLKSPFRIISLPGLLLVASGVLAIFVPFFVNNRAGVVVPFFDLLIISYLVRRRLDMKLLLWAGTIVVGLVLVGSVLRSGTGISSFYDQVFGGRYLIDITKTAHIVSYFNSGDDMLWGLSLTTWIYQIFPFFEAPDQELVNIGFFLGREVFGYVASGVPPGIVAELFINFGWPGVTVGMFFFGWLLKYYYLKYGRAENDLESFVIYAMICTRFTVFLFNNGFSVALLKTILDIVGLLVFLSLIRTRKRVA